MAQKLFFKKEHTEDGQRRRTFTLDSAQEHGIIFFLGILMFNS